MQVKLGLLEQTLISLNNLRKEKMPMSISRKLRILNNKLSEEYKGFEEDRISLVKQYAKIDEKGDLIPDDKGLAQFEEDKRKEFNKEFNELLNVEIDIEFESVNEKDLDNILISSVDEEFLINLGILIEM